MRKKEYLKSRSVIVQGIHSPKRFWFACGLSLGLVSLPLSTFANNWSNQLGSSIQKSIQQNRIITGSVIDESGEALIGVSVLVKGTTNGTITDINGQFTLTNISPTNKTIIVSFIGMETQEVTIKPEMKIVMTSTTEVMEEVLVVAYGTAKKSAFTGSAKMIHTEQITKRPVTNVIESLSGQVAGLQMTMTNGQPGETPSILIRGIRYMPKHTILRHTFLKDLMAVPSTLPLLSSAGLYIEV